MNSSLRLIRLNEVMDKTGLCKSSVYSKIKDGTFPPPVAIGARSVAWPSYEVDIVINTLIGGKSEFYMKKLVSSLVEKRKD